MRFVKISGAPKELENNLHPTVYKELPEDIKKFYKVVFWDSMPMRLPTNLQFSELQLLRRYGKL